MTPPTPKKIVHTCLTPGYTFLCLASALARHDLTDLIPATIDIALPRGRRRPSVQAPVTWHLFAPATFDIDRGQLPLDDQLSIGLYGQARCILDAFRLRHREGPAAQSSSTGGGRSLSRSVPRWISSGQLPQIAAG